MIKGSACILKDDTQHWQDNQQNDAEWRLHGAEVMNEY